MWSYFCNCDNTLESLDKMDGILLICNLPKFTQETRGNLNKWTFIENNEEKRPISKEEIL